MRMLETKYKKNRLTISDLICLRAEVNKSEDKEIETLMESSWSDFGPDDYDVPQLRLDRIKRKIDMETSLSLRMMYRFKLIMRIAAVVLFPVLVLTTIYFYRETQSLNIEKMVVSTGKEENAGILLPDGTKVSLNSNSSLAYFSHVFNKNERSVYFEGEAYFDVESNPAIPFFITTPDVQIKVLGTKFNFRARNNRDDIELDLEEGTVLFTSLSTKEFKKINSKQTIVLNKITGELTVLQRDTKSVGGWRNRNLVFRNARLKDVLKLIEDYYGVKIVLENEISDDLFTGTITTRNISEALLIIEKSFHLHSIIIGDDIRLVRND